MKPATTLEEERREVLESILDGMQIAEPDADRTAACSYLLRHLASTESRARSAVTGSIMDPGRKTVWDPPQQQLPSGWPPLDRLRSLRRMSAVPLFLTAKYWG